MSGLSFKGASNFTITDGNFGEIRGNVLTCNVIRPLENYDGNWPPPARSSGASSYFGPSHRHGRRERSKSRPTATQTPFLLPSPDLINTSSPVPASSVPISVTAAPASPTVQLSAPTSSSSEGSHLDDSKDGNDSDSSESSGYERYSTPLSGIDTEDSELGHPHSRPSDLPSSTSRPLPRQPNCPALLTPHSDTLTTRHPTPATRSQTLSANHRAPLGVRASEVQPTCVDHNQGTGLPPMVAPQPRKARNFIHPLPHPLEPYPRQTPSSTTWYSHAYRPSTYRGSYIQSLPLNKWDGSSGASRQLSRQNWMGGVCGYEYRCGCGHPAMYLSGDPGRPGFPAFYEASPCRGTSRTTFMN